MQGLAALGSEVRVDEIPCHSEPDLFFAESPDEVELAKSLCRGCPIRRPCLEGAVERREPWGIWGGELFDEGVLVLRKRPRGRPRKSAPYEREVSDGRCAAARS